ncbi:MAG: ABC transporter ATP-binding protein [Ideonella sp.]|nr:ABC transporter ATP-binding protein [Ideonella sp.]
MTALLRVQGLEAGYGSSQVLFGLDFSLGAGEVITLLGRNGMGKSTTIKCLSGLLAPSAGRIELGGVALVGLPSYRIARAGVGLVPEGRQVFPNLTVRENLVATASLRNAGGTPWTLERVFALFPRLKERTSQLAGKMSGGEQQMLAVGRALMTNPKLLLLDEATEGLAPLIRLEIWNCVRRLKDEGMAMIVIDKNLRPLMPLADRHYIVEKGRIAWQGDSSALQDDTAVVERYLSV